MVVTFLSSKVLCVSCLMLQNSLSLDLWQEGTLNACVISILERNSSLSLTSYMAINPFFRHTYPIMKRIHEYKS